MYKYLKYGILDKILLNIFIAIIKISKKFCKCYLVRI